VRDIPKKIVGVDEIEILVIDDGSEDKTIEIAKQIKVAHIVRNIKNRGLAYSFHLGIDACLRLGADIIINTDGDNQYKGNDIPKLIDPILKGKADIVIGNRQTDRIEHFSPIKKRLQKLGSFVVNKLSRTDVPDVVSGFRAFTREAAMRINITSTFSYTIETIIQAGKNNLSIASVPIRVNPKTRKSRLFKNVPNFLEQCLKTMIRTYAMYNPLRVFCFIGSIFFIGGLFPSSRFLYFYLIGDGAGHVQSLILSSILLIVGFQIFMIGLLADVISCNRKLIEETLLRVKKIEMR